MIARTAFVAFAVTALLIAHVPLACGQANFAGPRVGNNAYNPMGHSLNWLFNPQVQKELEIVPEQKEKLTKIRTESMAEMRELYKSLSEVDPAKRQEKYLEAYKKLGAETEEKVQAVLLDNQSDRLRQIVLQMKLRHTGYGSANALSNDDLSEALGLTDEQKEQLREKEKEVRAEIARKTREFHDKLREESREEIFSVLTEAQRKKLDDLMGEQYDWQATQWQGAAKEKSEE